MKGILVTSLILFLSGLHAQEESTTWKQDTVDGVAFVFPEPHRSYDSPEASGLIYHQGDVFITLTSIPDTTGRAFETREDLARYYTETLAKAVRRLNGRLLEVTDTVCAEIPAHFSRVEVVHPKGGITHYELLQIMVGKTLQAFSCQYVPTDLQSKLLRDKFFASIHKAERPLSGQGAPVGGFPWYLIAMVLVAVFLGSILWRTRGVSAKLVLAIPL